MNYTIVNEISLTTRQQMQCTVNNTTEEDVCKVANSRFTWNMNMFSSLVTWTWTNSAQHILPKPPNSGYQNYQKKRTVTEYSQAGIAKVTELKWNIDNIDCRLSSFQELDMSQQTQLRLYINNTYRKMWIISFAAVCFGCTLPLHSCSISVIWKHFTLPSPQNRPPNRTIFK